MSQQQLGKVRTRCPGKGLPPGRKRSLKPGVALSELMAPDPTGCSVDGHTHMCTHTCANTGAHMHTRVLSSRPGMHSTQWALTGSAYPQNWATFCTCQF